MIQVKFYFPEDIPVRELPQGELAVITKWGTCSDKIGTIVQLCGETLEMIGKNDGWTPPPSSKNHRVRILPKGTILEVV